MKFIFWASESQIPSNKQTTVSFPPFGTGTLFGLRMRIHYAISARYVVTAAA